MILMVAMEYGQSLQYIPQHYHNLDALTSRTRAWIHSRSSSTRSSRCRRCNRSSRSRGTPTSSFPSGLSLFLRLNLLYHNLYLLKVK
jgi:hypothetical protein